MAGEVYPILLRNDVAEGTIQWLDLFPYTSQRSFPYTAMGQTGYVNPDLAPQTDHIDVLADGDTTGGGNDVGVTQADEDGLVAYFRDRIDADPGGANLSLSPAGAFRVVNLIYNEAIQGNDVTQAVIEAFLTAVAGGPTDLDGATVGGSTSFGDMEEVMRIISGQRYRVPINSIVTTDTGAGSNFLGLPARNVLLAAVVPAQGVFYGQGEFLAYCDPSVLSCAWPNSPDFVDFLQLYLSGMLRMSLAEGNLSHLVDPTFVLGDDDGNGNLDFVYGGRANAQQTPATTTAPRLALTSISAANPGVCTTVEDHGLQNGDVVFISDALGGVRADGNPVTNTYTVTVTGANTFTCGVNFTTAAAGGFVTFGTTPFDIPAGAAGAVLALYNADGTRLT